MRVANIPIGAGHPLVFICGPCVIESEEMTIAIARHLEEIRTKLGVSIIFKASWDKANRTSVNSYRGQGFTNGRAILFKVQEMGLPITTDFHEPAQMENIVAADLIQIPALLCRQTSLLGAAAETGRPVNVKCGQFMAPSAMVNVVEKLEAFGCKDVMITYRGSCFGHGDIVSDFRAIRTMQKFGVPVIFDASHTSQFPGALGDRSGGNRSLIPMLARCGVAAGADGIFFECHPNPNKALSDGPSSLHLHDAEKLIGSCLRIRQAMEEDGAEASDDSAGPD